MSMLKKLVWMADDDEFDHIVKNSQRVLRLNDQYENHPYVEEFARVRCYVCIWNIRFRGEVDAKFLWVI